MEPSLVKFIKKIPPSGGAPAFKLTLPHQIVHSHLMHLVDEGFELAPTATVQTSWQASIAPRRNKERSEYTLQGWKLFAEAHKIQAGDQVSFELVHPRRMVVQVIQAADPDAVVVRPRERAAASGSASKARKYRGSSSPRRSEQYLPAEEEMQDLWMDAPSLDVSEDYTPLARVSEDSSYMDITPPQNIGHMYPSQASQSFEGWVPVDARNPPLANAPRVTGPRTGPRIRGLPSVASHENLVARPRGSPDSQSSRLPRCSSLSALHSSGTVASTSGFYSDLLHSPHSSGNFKGDQSLMPSGMFDGIIFDQAEDDLPPMPAPRRTPPPVAGEQLPIDHQLGSLTTTIQKLQDDAAFYRAQADRCESETAHLHNLFASQQVQLDRQAREALRAAMGLEKCASALAGKAADGSEHLSGVVTDMTGCLGTLKGTLWQLLVLASHEEDDPTGHPAPAPAE